MVAAGSKTLYRLLSTGSTLGDLSQHDCKLVDWEVKNKKKTAESRAAIWPV